MTASIARLNDKPQAVLFSPLIDVLVGAGGFSLLLLLILYASHSNTSPIWMTSVVFWAGVAVNNPHYAATYYRVYRSIGEIKKYAVAAVIAPLLLIGLAVACFVSPLIFAPWYCKAYILGSGYHYSGQSYGMAMIYSKKSGLNIPTLQKWCIGLPIFMSYFWGMFGNETNNSIQRSFFGVTLPVLGLSDYVALPMLLTFGIGIEAYIALNLYLWWRQKKSLPPIVHVIVLSHCTWFTIWSFQPFTEMVPFFHCFQYLLITSYFYMQELVKSGKYVGKTGLSYLKSHQFLYYYGFLIALGYSLFFIVPKVVSSTGLCTFALANAVIFSFINLHHFVLDGEIWKLRKPELTKAIIG